MRSRTRTALAASILGVVMLSSCGREAPPAPEVRGPAGAGLPEVIPEADRNRPNPLPASERSLASGKRSFSTLCAPCHATDGSGRGELSARLRLDMPSFLDGHQQARRTDGEWFYILTEGHGAMPGQEDRLSDDAKWDLINYVRSLERNE